MSIFSRQHAVFALFVLGASACGDSPTDLGPHEQPSGNEQIDTAPIIRENPAPDAGATTTDAGAATSDAGAATSDAGAANPGEMDGGQATTPDAGVVEGQPDSGVVTHDGPFAAAYAVLNANCVSCHGTGKALDMSTAELAHEQLVGVEAKYKACATDGGAAKVRGVPGAPESSLLIEKIEGHPSCGKQMPMNMLMNPEDIATVRAWVAAGAPSP